jgi:hypothetical protein
MSSTFQAMSLSIRMSAVVRLRFGICGKRRHIYASKLNRRITLYYQERRGFAGRVKTSGWGCDFQPDGIAALAKMLVLSAN